MDTNKNEKLFFEVSLFNTEKVSIFNFVKYLIFKRFPEK